MLGLRWLWLLPRLLKRLRRLRHRSRFDPQAAWRLRRLGSRRRHRLGPRRLQLRWLSLGSLDLRRLSLRRVARRHRHALRRIRLLGIRLLWIS